MTDNIGAMPTAHSGVRWTEPSFTVSALRAPDAIARKGAAILRWERKK